MDNSIKLDFFPIICVTAKICHIYKRLVKKILAKSTHTERTYRPKNSRHYSITINDQLCSVCILYDMSFYVQVFSYYFFNNF